MPVIGSSRMVPGPKAAASGTVTSVSVVSANGLAGTVATPTTTPAITLSTSVTGIVKGNGTTLAAAVAGTDYVASISNGYGITGATGGTPAPAVSLTSASGSMPSDVTFTSTIATILTTASLGIGTWLVNASFSIQSTSSSSGFAELEAIVGTATATITGQSTATIVGAGLATSGTSAVQVSLTFVVVVTVAGTFIFRAQAEAADVTTWTAKAASGPRFTGATASGYTAIRIA